MNFRAWGLSAGALCTILAAQGMYSPAFGQLEWSIPWISDIRCEGTFTLTVSKMFDAVGNDRYVLRAEGGGPAGAGDSLDALFATMAGPASRELPAYAIDENSCDRNWFDQALIHIDRFKDLPAWTFRITGLAIDVEATFESPCSEEITAVQDRPALTLTRLSYLVPDCPAPVPPLTAPDVARVLEGVRSCGALAVDAPADGIAFAPDETVVLTGRARDAGRRDAVSAAVQAIAGARPVDLRRIDIEGAHRALCDMTEIEERAGPYAPMLMVIRHLDGTRVVENPQTGMFEPGFGVGEQILVDLRSVPASGYLYAFSVDIGRSLNDPAILIPYDNTRDSEVKPEHRGYSRTVNDLRYDQIYYEPTRMRLTVPAPRFGATHLESGFGDAPSIEFEEKEEDGERIVFFAFVTDRRIDLNGSDILPLEADFDEYWKAVLRPVIEGEVEVMDVARFEAWKAR